MSSSPYKDRRSIGRRQLRRSSGFQLSRSPQVRYPIDINNLPLESPHMLSKFADLSDAMDELSENKRSLSTIHNSISEFNESFSSFLYGLSLTMWCVDFTGAPNPKAWEQLQNKNQREERIIELKRKLANLQESNSILKTTIQEESKHLPTTSVLPSSRTTRTTRVVSGRTGSTGYSRIQKPRVDDESSLSIPTTPAASSYTSKTVNGHNNTSGVVRPASKIQQPTTRIKSGIPAAARGPVRQQQQQQYRQQPNLNQPPRYMNSNYSRIAKPTTSSTGRIARKPALNSNTIANRPPFR